MCVDKHCSTFEIVEILFRESKPKYFHLHQIGSLLPSNYLSTMGSPHDQRRRELFFESIAAKKVELSGLDKLTAENHPTWASQIVNYLTTNQLADFLTPKTDYLSSYALRQERLLGELILSTVSDDFVEVYLKEFKFRLFSDLWCELERCCQSPVNVLKPAINELKSIKRKDCDSLKDYCEKFENALNQIPTELLDQNLHNIFSIWYGPNVHLCCKRLAEQNTRLILPKEKLRGAQSGYGARAGQSGNDARAAQRTGNRFTNRPPAMNHPQNAARPPWFDQTRRQPAPQAVPVFRFGQANNRPPAPFNHHNRQYRQQHARFPPATSSRLPFTRLPDGSSSPSFRGGNGQGVCSATNQQSPPITRPTDPDSPVEPTSQHVPEALSSVESSTTRSPVL